MQYGRRRLPFPYSYTVQDVFENGVTVSPESLIPIRTDCNLLILELTDLDLFRLTSALQAGLDLIYPCSWQTLMDRWDYASLLANTGNFVSCDGTEILSLCDIVADCISSPGGPANIAITELITNITQLPPETTEPVPTLDNTLDCIWGASFGSYELVLDAWEEFQTVVQAAADFLDAVNQIKKILPGITSAQMELIEAAVTVGTAAINSYVNAQEQQDAFACALFDCIRNNGTNPPAITNACIDAAFATMDTQFLGVQAGIGSLLQPFVAYSTFKTYWRRISDDQCSNDWIVACGGNCGAALPRLEDWTDSRILSINPVPTFTDGGKAITYTNAPSQFTVTFDDLYCFGNFDITLERAFLASVPTVVGFTVGSNTEVSDDSGGFGPGDLTGDFADRVGATLTVRVLDPNNFSGVFSLSFLGGSQKGIDLSEFNP